MTEYLQDFEEVIRKDIPGFKVAYKSESLLMKVLAFLTYPFNPYFMRGYITTWGNKVYFPDEDYYKGPPKRSVFTLAHEYVHLLDSKKHPVLFKLGYIFPQVLSLLPAVVLIIWGSGWPLLVLLGGYLLGCLLARLHRSLFWIVISLSVLGSLTMAWFLCGWWSLALLGFFVLLLPLPAPWRTHYELRGYSMTIALYRWGYGPTIDLAGMLSAMQHEFIGPPYYYMSYSSKGVLNELARVFAAAGNGTLQSSGTYAVVHKFLSDHGLLHGD